MGMEPGWLLLLFVLVLLAFLLWWLLGRGEPEPDYGFEPDASVDVVPPGRVREAIRDSIASAVVVASPDGEPIDRLVWSDLGDEVLVHLDSLSLEVDDGLIRAGLDLQSDQTGRQTLVVPIAVGRRREEGLAIAVTESVPIGHEGLAARWGQALQAAVWSGLLDYARERAEVAEGIPGRIWVQDGLVFFEASQPLRVTPPTRLESASDGAGGVRGTP